MLILAHLLNGIAGILSIVLTLLVYIIIGRIIISWVNADPYNPVVRFLVASSEPLLAPLRRFIPLVGRSIDLTPLVLIIIIQFLQLSLVPLINDYGIRLRMYELPAGAIRP